MNFRFCLRFVSVLMCSMLLSGLAVVQGQSAAPSKAPAQGAAQKAPAPSAKPAETAASLMDINTATRQQLMTLPGIGEALSQKIIDGRPYRAKNELTQKKIIPEATYEKISGLIIAKQGAAPATPATPESKGTSATPATPSSGASKAPATSPAKEKSR